MFTNIQSNDHDHKTVFSAYNKCISFLCVISDFLCVISNFLCMISNFLCVISDF